MERLDAWITAEALVGQIVAQHGLEEIKETTGMLTSVITSTPVTNPSTKVDQHIEHIMNVANWLLESG